MNLHPPTGSSDEILIPQFGPLLPPAHPDRLSSSLPAHTSEEALRLALLEAFGDSIPTWDETLIVARSLGSF